MLDELDQPFVGKIVEEATNVGIEYPVHLLPHNSDPQRIQGLVLTAPGPESIGEPQKVLFVNLVEDRHHRSLDQLILQGCDAQGTLPPISFRDVGSLGRLRSIRSPMDAAMQVRQFFLQVRAVLLPGHAVDSGRRLALQRVVAVPQQWTVTWWSSAVNRVRLSLRAASRTPRRSFNSLVRLWVRGGVACPMFSLVGRLPSMPSADACSPLFGHFAGTIRPSDPPSTCMLAVRLKAFSNRPAASAPAGVDGVSRFSRVEFPCMPGVLDCAASCGDSRWRLCRYCLPPC